MTDLTVAIYQPAAGGKDVGARLGDLASMAAQAAQAGADILVTPELFLSGYNIGELIAERATPSGGACFTRCMEIAADTGLTLVCGYPERDGAAVYNAAMVVGPKGRIAHHRKQALPGEFEKSAFTPGGMYTRFTLLGWEIALIICYEIEFPEITRAAALSGAELLIAPTALKAEWAFVAEKLVPTRAFENGMFTAYANHAGAEGDFTYLGGSRIDGPDGAPRAVASGGEGIIYATLSKSDIDKARRKLPYLHDLTALKR